MKNFLNKLGITKIGYYNGDNYIIDLDNDLEFSKVYSKLDKSELLEPDDEYSSINLIESSIKYFNDDYELTLSANFENDEYKLIVSEVKANR